MAQIGYQSFKLIAYQRLHEMAKQWEDRYPGVDILLIEPEPDDELMFQTSVMNFTKRLDIARHGFQSVTMKLATDYDRFKEVADRHGEVAQLVTADPVDPGNDHTVGGGRGQLGGTTARGLPAQRLELVPGGLELGQTLLDALHQFLGGNAEERRRLGQHGRRPQRQAGGGAPATRSRRHRRTGVRRRPDSAPCG